MFNGDLEKQKFFDEWYDSFCKATNRTPTVEEFWAMVDTINGVYKIDEN